MAFCKYCGKQIPDGTSCDCQQAQAESNPDITNNISDGYTPDSNEGFNPYADQTAADEAAPKSKKNLILAGVCAAVVLILALIILISSAANAYKKPIKNFVKGFNKNDLELMVEQIAPKDTMKSIKDLVEDETEYDWDELCDEAKDSMEDLKDDLEDDYGKRVKLSVEILDKKKAKNKEVKAIEDMYESIADLSDDIDLDADVKKVYKVKAEFTIKGKDDDDSFKLSLYTVKLKGDGWKLMMDESLLIDNLSEFGLSTYDMYDLVDELEDSFDF